MWYDNLYSQAAYVMVWTVVKFVVQLCAVVLKEQLTETRVNVNEHRTT